tara:strand:+ start:373 stop:504 length:132 start_codon:yes stop_codon:yes gene_type:complete
MDKAQQQKLFKQWKQKLSNSKLSSKDIIKRAKEFTRKGMSVND